jgi:hypothetical protein
MTDENIELEDAEPVEPDEAEVAEGVADDPLEDDE